MGYVLPFLMASLTLDHVSFWPYGPLCSAWALYAGLSGASTVATHQVLCVPRTYKRTLFMTTSGDHPLRQWSDVLMPRTFTLWIMVLGVASVVSQAGIIVTGGAVRLTASGLGCSEWPRCAPDSYVTTPEMGMHGVIEFGNRLLTFVLAAIAVLTIVALWRLRKTHRGLFVMSVILFLGIPGQAVIGGITVWTGLNPWVVMFHFLLSAAMVSVATLVAPRIGAERRARKP